MLSANLWRKLSGVDHGVVIEDVEIEEEDGEEVVVVHVRLRKDRRRRCGRCGKRAPGYAGWWWSARRPPSTRCADVPGVRLRHVVLCVL